MRSVVETDFSDIRFDCGFTKPLQKLELSDKDALIKAIWLHYMYFLPLAELQQLRKGLRETLQLEILFCIHPEDMFGFLVASSNFNVTPEFLLDSFAVKYSDAGSNKRTAEESVMLHWHDYVIENEGNQVILLQAYFTVNTCIGQIGEILHFIAGCSKLPAAGFNSIPKIEFTDRNCLPRSSTCAIGITFQWLFGSYDQF